MIENWTDEVARQYLDTVPDTPEKVLDWAKDVVQAHKKEYWDYTGAYIRLCEARNKYEHLWGAITKFVKQVEYNEKQQDIARARAYKLDQAGKEYASKVANDMTGGLLGVNPPSPEAVPMSDIINGKNNV